MHFYVVCLEGKCKIVAVSILKLAGDTGFEPVNDDFKDRCLRPDLANPQQNWHRHQESNLRLDLRRVL